MTSEELISQQINKVKGVRQPTRGDVIETLLLIQDQTQDFRKFYMSNYYNAVSDNPEKAIDDLLSYSEFTAEVTA